MLIDLHAHSSGISKCCRIPIEQVIEEAKKVGIDGIVLTNHYQKNYVADGDYTAFAARYIAEYEYAAELVKNTDFRIFFGIEVTMEKNPGVHMLIYGVKTDFLLAHPMLFDDSQEELYRLVHEAGGILVQAHPMRRQNRLLDTKYLDGIETFNGHFGHASRNKIADAWADIHGLRKTSGTDFHEKCHICCGGILTDEPIKDSKELVEVLNSDSYELMVDYNIAP